MRQEAYRLKMREVLESEPNLKIKQAEVAELIVEARLPASGSGAREGEVEPQLQPEN